MSLKMNEADWQIALEVFRACLPARGAKAKDDRRFLEALRFFVVHNITGGRCRNGSGLGTASGKGSIV
jgi:hypothetical protein